MVVDVGIHAYGWSADKAKQYFLAQTGRSEAVAELEISRTIWPGAQLAYKVGEGRIRGMRNRAEQMLESKFDMRGFHDSMLRWGPLPLDVLERKVNECLNDPHCSLSFRLP